ncbi:MAG: 3-dehydroquinate synthase [Chitinophagaceae bacterium]|nr:3-dehydroquinate synthase [Chitinophagaceae bacterium]
MQIAEYTFSQKKVSCYFDADFAGIKDLLQDAWTVIITDENLYNLHAEKLAGYRVIKIAAGEEYKNQFTVDSIIEELLLMGANKNTFLIGLGGGVVTDITGYVAAVYMRGIKFGFVPTSILAMVDAAIGGKNGIDVGVYKNMIGTIRQPEFIFYDYSFLKTLPVKEWVNGFAEVIKHACIKDALLFKVLEKYTLHEYQADSTLIADLIEKNVAIKTGVVIDDEFETGDRKLLNFGHTIGHAIENLHGIPHGHAVSIGMIAACNLSVQLNNFHADDAARIVRLLSRYHLPVDVETDHAKVFDVLKMDKKRTGDGVQFILLSSIGKAEIKYISLAELEKHFKEIV